MGTKRVQWVDIVKFVCIMWVMLSHLDARTDFLKVFYSPFFLNGFFFASGYVYNHKDNFSVFFKKKVKGLFFPWLFFSIFNILLSQVLSFNEHTSLLEELKWNFLQIRGMYDGVWFVAALFVTFIPFYFFIGMYESKKINTKTILAIGFILSLISSTYTTFMNPDLLPWGSAHLPWHIEYIFVAMFWMLLGYLFKNKCEEWFDKKTNVSTKAVSGLVYLSLVFIPYFLHIDLSNKAIDLIYTYASAFVGVYCLIWLSKSIKPNRFFLYIGQNTLICFAVHGKIYSVMQTVFRKLAGGLYESILSNEVKSTLFAIAFTIVLSVILIVPIYVINRWFPFLVGRKLKKTVKN